MFAKPPNAVRLGAGVRSTEALLGRAEKEVGERLRIQLENVRLDGELDSSVASGRGAVIATGSGNGKEEAWA